MTALPLVLPLVLVLLLLPPATSFPLSLPRHLRPTLPRLPHHPALQLSETRTHVLATLTHPSLNATATARITVSTNPLTLHIDTLSTRLTRRIPLSATFTNFSIAARPGAIVLRLRKTVADLPRAIASCNGSEACLAGLARRACLPVHLRVALRALPCGGRCAERVLEDCQKADLLTECAALLTHVVFAVVAGVILITYGWGFVSAIASFPRELTRLLCWGGDVWQRIRVEGVKLGILDALTKLVL